MLFSEYEQTNTVLSVARKNREWSCYEYPCVRVQDVHKANGIIQVGFMVCGCMYIGWHLHLGIEQLSTQYTHCAVACYTELHLQQSCIQPQKAPENR